MSNAIVLNLIQDYLGDIRLIINLFKKKYGRTDILRAWHEGVIPQCGNIGDTAEYELHGIGCSVFFPDRNVDFDFGPEQRIDGFDLWRLKKYLDQRPDVKKYINGEKLEIFFDQLIESKIIVKEYQNSNLYFLFENKNT